MKLRRQHPLYIELIYTDSEFKGFLTFPKRHSGPFSNIKLPSSLVPGIFKCWIMGNIHIVSLERNPFSICENSLSESDCMEMFDECYKGKCTYCYKYKKRSIQNLKCFIIIGDHHQLSTVG